MLTHVRDQCRPMAIVVACFLRHISRMQSFQENSAGAAGLELGRSSKICHIIFQARVALKPLVSLISHLVACSSRISIDRQTDRPITVTLAAHARRGLTSSQQTLQRQEQQTESSECHCTIAPSL